MGLFTKIQRMGRAKQIILKPVTSKRGNYFIRLNHYSGKVVPNSQLHLGVFLDNKLHGVMQFGPSIDKRNLIGLVNGTKWNEFIELNRMAFDDYLPKNSESRAISIAMRLIKKHKPCIKWVISFADATQCGTGTIYRASGFKLISIVENTAIKINPITKEKIHVIQAYHKNLFEYKNWEKLKGYQIKYIYFIDKSYEEKLTVPILPFSKLDELNYPKGVKHKEYLKADVM